MALRDKDSTSAPIALAAGLWMLHGGFVGHATNHCLDACMTLRYAYEYFGIFSRVELLQVEVEGDGGPTRHGAEHARWNPDGTFDGHAVLFLPSAGFLVDATIAQFPEVPFDSLVGQVVPVVLSLPGEVRFDGQDVIAVARDDHRVTYLPGAGSTELLSHPILRQGEPHYRRAASNLASKTLAMLNDGELAELFPTSPYPRLQRLRDELSGAELVERGADFVFRRHTGVEIHLTDIP